MPNILREVRVLSQEGKLHRRLVSRTRIFLVISLVLLVIVGYNIAIIGTNAFLAVLFLVLGYIVGFLVFSRMTPIQWNASTEQIEAGAMNALGWGLIALYIVFEIGARTELARILPGAGSEGYVLAIICGVLLGRAFGVIREIHRVYIATH